MAPRDPIRRSHRCGGRRRLKAYASDADHLSRRLAALSIRHALLRRCHALRDEGGFTLVEALAAITLLGVGSFAAAQAITLGLSTSGVARQRLAARSAVDQQMEEARALNYDNLVLSDSSPLTHSTDADNPDYWIDATAQTYDPDGAGSLSAEPIVRVAGASPALQHYQNPVVQGNTTYSVYRYVTWVNSPTDDTGTSDAADGNADGLSDANGQDQKRVTIIVTWTDAIDGTTVSSRQSSLFSDGKITYHTPAHNAKPSVSCPTANVQADGLTVDFTGVASDSDGTIATYSWTFGDGATGTGPTVTHTYAAANTYTVVTSVVDNGGGTNSNASLNCHVTTFNPLLGNGGMGGTLSINSNAVFTTGTNVSLTLTYSGGTVPTSVVFSNDGTTWSAPQTYGTPTPWVLVAGDGTKTVYMRYWNAAGQYGPQVTDTVILDGTAPGTPTLSATTTTSGANKNVSLSWTAVSDSGSGLGGYRLYKRLITSTGAWTLVASTSSTSYTDTFKKTDTYNYYVQAYDNAGNLGANSNTVSG